MYKILIFLLITTLLTACQLLGPNPEEIARQKKITQLNLLFEQINEDIQAKRLSTPKNNNALLKLNEVTQLSPDHPAIPGIKASIAKAYVDLVAPALQKDNLEAAQHYLNSALTISPETKEGISASEKLIADYIAEKDRKAKLEQAQLEEKQAAAAQAAAREKQLAAIAKEKTRIARLTITHLNQAEINARSKQVGIALDKASQIIVKNNAPIIIQAQSNRDYKWLAALLRTSIYFIDSTFTLSATAQINADEPPLIRYADY
ncbi:MAG TPA: hypothetical protein VIM85_12035 [Pseudomonadales bacterium]